MLTIRREQMRVFEQQELDRFRHRMVEYLLEFFPTYCRGLREEELRNTVRHAGERASYYGIVIERDVAKYVCLALIFGKEFDIDTTQSWAEAILRSQDFENGTDRIDQLWSESERLMRDREA